jgi:hypothetical protein
MWYTDMSRRSSYLDDELLISAQEELKRVRRDALVARQLAV